MKKDNIPYLANWFAISLRWLCLLASAIMLSAYKVFFWPIIVVLLISTAWNMAMTYLAITNKQMAFHRFANVLIDLLVSVSLYLLAGGIFGPLNWIGIQTLFTVAVFYDWIGGLILAFGLIGIQFSAFYLLFGGFELGIHLFPFLGLSVYQLGAGIVLSLISRSLKINFQKNYDQLVYTQRELEKSLLKKERARMQTFSQLTETLSSTLNYNVVLSTTLNLALTALEDRDNTQDKLISAVLLFDGHDLVMANARRFAPADVNRVFPGEQGILHDTITIREPQISLAPANDPELGVLLAIQSCKSAITLPLARGLDAYGLMLFAHPDQHYFNADRVEILTLISRQAVIAIQNARLYQQLEQEKQMIVETQEVTRKQLARDLHDGPTQSVSSIAMRLSVVRKMMEIAPRDVSPELEQIEKLARRTTEEIRHMLFTMRPLVLESEGLIAGLNEIAEKTLHTFKQKVRIEADQAVVNQLDKAKQTVVFYLVEEAVNNARKHAQADLIWVRLRYNPGDDEIALLEILDNGVGFDIEEVKQGYDRRNSLGMVNLRERTQLVNGLLNIDSVRGRGTRIQIYIPLSQSAVERIQHGKLKTG